MVTINATIFVNNVAEAPTDISLSVSTVNENMAVGTVVGTFTTTYTDSSVFTYVVDDTNNIVNCDPADILLTVSNNTSKPHLEWK